MEPLQFDIFGIFASPEVFLLFFILICGGIGMFSRKLSVTVFGALLGYAHVVLKTDLFIYDAILYVVLFIILLWASQFVVAGYFNSEPEGE